MKPAIKIKPDWKWGTAEGSREFDRILDRDLSLHEKIQWLEEAETLSLYMHSESLSKSSTAREKNQR